MLPRIGPMTRRWAGPATRSGAGVPGPRGGACGPVASGALRSRSRDVPVLTSGSAAASSTDAGGDGEEAGDTGDPGRTTGDAPGIERRRGHRDVARDRVVVE
ncbi:hypothetical protein MRX96_031921 [Rhipicephalus microplus]